MYENGPLYCFDTHPDIVFISRDSLMPLYKMLRIDCAFGVSFQDWFDLVQHAAEESVRGGGGARTSVENAHVCFSSERSKLINLRFTLHWPV